MWYRHSSTKNTALSSQSSVTEVTQVLFFPLTRLLSKPFTVIIYCLWIANIFWPYCECFSFSVVCDSSHLRRKWSVLASPITNKQHIFTFKFNTWTATNTEQNGEVLKENKPKSKLMAVNRHSLILQFLIMDCHFNVN